MEKRENRITLPKHLRNRAEQRAAELGYSSLLEYVSELVVVDTSPLIARSIAQPQTPAPGDQANITVTSGNGWGAEI